MSIRDRVKAELKKALGLTPPPSRLGVDAPVSAPAPPPRAPAPVFLYVEWDSPGRAQMEAHLRERNIPYKLLEIDHDEPMQEFVARSKIGKPPALFIAGDPVGGLDELKALPDDELRRRVFR